MNYFLIYILGTGVPTYLLAEEVKVKPAAISEVILQFSNDKYIFEAVRQPLGKKVERRTGNIFKPPFRNIVIYRIRKITPKGKSIFKEITYNELMNARRYDFVQQASIKQRPYARVEDEVDEIPEYTAWLDLLDFNPSAGVACFNGYDPLDGKTTTSPIFYYNLGTNSFRFAGSTLTQEGKASISPSGKYLAMRQVISENWDSIQVIRLGEHPTSLGLIMNDENEKAIQDGQSVKDELLGWEGDDHIKVKHRVSAGKKEQIVPTSYQVDEGTPLVIAVEPSTPMGRATKSGNR